MLLDLLLSMNVTLIHNPTAGSGQPSCVDLLDALTRAGHDVVHRSTTDPGVPEVVQEAGDLVLAAGGDGTVRTVALNVRRGVPISILPLGTANNLATTLGLEPGLDACLRRIAGGRRRAVDVGSCDGAWGPHRFIEGAGFGLVPELIRVVEKFSLSMADADPRAELDHARSVLVSLVGLLPSFDCTLTLDGTTRTRRLILLEVLNAQRVGPSLPLAPAADPGDGRLDVVWVVDSQRESLARAVGEWAAGRASDFACGSAAASRVGISCNAPIAHIDDELWKPSQRQRAAGFDVNIDSDPGPFSVLI